MNQFAYVTGFGSRSNVHLGPACKHLPVDELAAVIAHEHGHIVMGHRLERVKWLLTAKWRDVPKWRKACWEQELQADIRATFLGHGRALARFIRHHAPEHGSMWHPPKWQRLAVIESTILEMANGKK